MGKGRQSGISYRDQEIKEDHSYAAKHGLRPGYQKFYMCRVGGKTVRGTLEQVKADIDFHLDKKTDS